MSRQLLNSQAASILIAYFFLTLAIAGDVAATGLLKASGGFTKLVPSACALFGYLVVLISLCLTLKVLPFGFTYAAWAGLGAVGAAIVGAAFFQEIYDTPRVIGTILIVAGVVMLYSAPHSQ